MRGEAGVSGRLESREMIVNLHKDKILVLTYA